MNRLIPLKIDFDMGRPDAFYPVLLMDEQEMILIDCCFPGFLPLIKQAACKEGADLDKLTKIILTHSDHDHIGALAELKEAYPHVQICASAEQAPYISGQKTSIRKEMFDKNKHLLAEDERAEEEDRLEMMSKIKKAFVDVILKPNEIINCCGGVEIVPTPGHMPGHLSIYAEEFKTLITGDALIADNGTLCPPNNKFTIDMDTALKSAENLLNYDIATIVCYHGGLVQGDIKAKLKQILAI